MTRYFLALTGLLCIPVFLRLPSSPSTSIPVPTYLQQGKLKPSLARGEKVYNSLCISCHQAGGTGVPRMNPPLKGIALIKGDKKVLIGIVLNGLKNVDIEDESYSNNMPSQKQLTDLEIADVLTYVRNSFGNTGSSVLPDDVAALRKK